MYICKNQTFKIMDTKQLINDEDMQILRLMQEKISQIQQSLAELQDLYGKLFFQ